MEECKICGKQIGNIGCLKLHVKSHGIEFDEYCIKYKLSIYVHKCKVCGKKVNNGRIYCSHTCRFNDIEYVAKHKSIDRTRKTQQDYDNSLECKECGKIIHDVMNFSGFAKKHLLEHEIITDNYLSYYNLIPKIKRSSIKCPLCDWTTHDLKNLGGSITYHMQHSHNITLPELSVTHPEFCISIGYDYSTKREAFMANENNYVICQICGEKLKFISNTHLKLHNISQAQYKKKYGNITSNSTLDLLKCNYANGLGKYEPNFVSAAETEICDFLRANGITNIIQSNRSIISPQELDIYIPDRNIAIEFNELYYHSEMNGKNKSYHLNKTINCDKKGIRLIHIFDDEWIKKKDIVLKRLLNILGKTDSRIYARNTTIKEITKEEKNKFLNETHIQGSDKSTIMLGSYYHDELIAVMTFLKPRFALGNKKKEQDKYELSRYATKNISYIGGASKLLSYFIKIYKPKSIISFADRRWSVGNLYEQLGFKKVNNGSPNYWYLNGYSERLHRFNFTKQRIINKFGGDSNLTEWDNMRAMGYDRIWDCGSLKYEITINN
jgi:hypothetical protein